MKKKLIVVQENDHSSIITYENDKAERHYPTGYYEALYEDKNNDLILETKTPSGVRKRIRIPSHVYFSLVELIPAYNYFKKNMVSDTIMIDGTEVISFKNRID